MTSVNMGVTPFDNEISILYKKAYELGYPVRLVIMSTLSRPGEDLIPPTLDEMLQKIEFIPLVSLVNDFIGRGLSLDQMYALLNNVDSTDLIMSYYGLLINRTDRNVLFAQIDSFSDSIKRYRFTDVRDLELNYSRWSEKINDDKRRDEEILGRLLNLQNTLQQYPKYPVSPINIHHVEKESNPIFRSSAGREPGTHPKPEDGIDIFNDAVVSNDAPYLQLNSLEIDENGNERRYYKVFQGESYERSPDFPNVILSKGETKLPNTIYMTVWSGEGDVRTKESWMKASYNLADNILNVSVPTVGDRPQDLVLKRIQDSLPVDLPTFREVGVGGEFYLYGIDVLEASFLDMILNDEIMSSYLYLDENLKAYPEKKRLSIHYKSALTELESSTKKIKSSTRVTLYQLYLENDTEVEVLDEQLNPVNVPYPKGTPYIYLKLTKAKTIQSARQFVFIFNHLMSYYMLSGHRNEIEASYQEWIGIKTLLPPGGIPPRRAKKGVLIPLGAAADKGVEGAEAEEEIGIEDEGAVGAKGTGTKGKTRGKAGKTGAKLAALQRVAPEIFVEGYGRMSQAGGQPVHIPNDKVDEWKNQTFTYKGVAYNRQVIHYPRENPKYYFGCDDDNYPFPGVKENKTLPNKDKYPYVPNCYSVDQRDKPTSGYSKYYNEGVLPIAKTRKSRHTIKGGIAGADRRGELPADLKNLLQEYIPEAKSIIRFGTIRSVNSFIHSILNAVKDPVYMSYDKDDFNSKENYAATIREEILTAINLSCMKQELYDFTEDAIRSMILDPTRFFDPYIFYRSMEEMFNLNIYVLTPGKIGESSKLEVPRHKFFHARVPRSDRQTVIIYKHHGDEKDLINYPQCEPISDFDSVAASHKLIFSSTVGTRLHEALLKINRIITWSTVSSASPAYSSSSFYSFPLGAPSVQYQGSQYQGSPSPQPYQGSASYKETEVEARENIYSLVDYVEVFKHKAVGQILDTWGKLRAYVVKDDRDELTVAVQPTQPENLEVYEGPVVPDYKTVMGIMGRPVALTRLDNVITGLWYPVMDLEYGVYCPATDKMGSGVKELADVKEGIPGPLSRNEGDVVSRVKLLHRTRNILLQLFVWFYLLFERDYPELNVDTFINDYFVMGQGGTSDKIYDLGNIPRRLPTVNTLKEALDFMRRVAPSLFSNEKIYLYSPKFYQGIAYFLREYEKITPPDQKIIPTQILGLFDEPEDFIAQPYTAIFTTEYDLNRWIKSFKKESFDNVIISKLELENGLLDEPYFYGSPDGKIYLVQNVASGDKLRAYQVCLNWIESKINTGYNTDPFHSSPSSLLPPSGTLDKYVLFGISNSGGLLILENKTSPTDFEFPLLLTYGSDHYAALLPLL